MGLMDRIKKVTGNKNHTWKKRQDGMDTPVYDISQMKLL